MNFVLKCLDHLLKVFDSVLKIFALNMLYFVLRMFCILQVVAQPWKQLIVGIPTEECVSIYINENSDDRKSDSVR